MRRLKWDAWCFVILPTVVALVLLAWATFASPALACNVATFPPCLGGTPFDATGCSAQYSEVLYTPRRDGEMALRLHFGITRECRNQAWDRWVCAMMRCYGRNLICPAISSACWHQIN